MVNKKLFIDAFFFLILSFGVLVWGSWVITSHPSDSIVSWDEGFHGGSALFISQSLRDNFSFGDYTYILNDFKNGMIWYPPLWLFLAGPMGAVFGSSVEVYRLATLIFAVFTIVTVTYFVKSISGYKAAIIAGVTLACTPIFIVYSHLMMREIPNIFGITLPLLLFYKYLTIKKTNSYLLFFTFLAFALGVLAKAISILIIFATVFSFGAVVYVFFRKEEIWERFYSRWTLYFLLIGLATFNLFRVFTQKVLNADLLFFHLEQTKDLTGERANILVVVSETILKNFTFYFRDFSHMPALTIFLIGSFVAYVLVKRSLMGLFLIIWVCVIYISFSAVKPQAPQYLLPIFAPLSIGIGLFWGNILSQFKRYKLFGLIFLVIAIVWLEIIHLEKTETIGWRNLITNQYQASLFIAKNAGYGDRVVSSGDGTRFLIRLLGFDKRLQTINGAAKICPDSIQDSTEWAVLEYGHQNPIRLQGIDNPGWIKQSSYPGTTEPINVYKNARETKKLIFNTENLIENRCARFLLPGKNQILVYATTKIKNNICPPESDLKINLQVNPLKSVGSIVISQEQIKSQSSIDQKYSLIFDQQKTNQPIYFYFDIPENIEFKVNKIEVINLGI